MSRIWRYIPDLSPAVTCLAYAGCKTIDLIHDKHSFLRASVSTPKIPTGAQRLIIILSVRSLPGPVKWWWFSKVSVLWTKKWTVSSIGVKALPQWTLTTLPRPINFSTFRPISDFTSSLLKCEIKTAMIVRSSCVCRQYGKLTWKIENIKVCNARSAAYLIWKRRYGWFTVSTVSAGFTHWALMISVRGQVALNSCWA